MNVLERLPLLHNCQPDHLSIWQMPVVCSILFFIKGNYEFCHLSNDDVDQNISFLSLKVNIKRKNKPNVEVERLYCIAD